MSLTLRRAFERQGVKLVYPSRSWGGVRYDDGAIVFAIRAEEVQVAKHGFSCLLWAPHLHGSEEAAGRERLRHCRLAFGHGGAEALLVDAGRHVVDPEHVLALRIVKHGSEYWARWEAPARAHAPVRPQTERRLLAA